MLSASSHRTLEAINGCVACRCLCAAAVLPVTVIVLLLCCLLLLLLLLLLPAGVAAGGAQVEVVKPRKGFLCGCGSMSSDDYKIELTFHFAAAEMRVTAYDVTNKCYANCHIEFASNATTSGGHVVLPSA
jgi:hypothetical protein